MRTIVNSIPCPCNYAFTLEKKYLLPVFCGFVVTIPYLESEHFDMVTGVPCGKVTLTMKAEKEVRALSRTKSQVSKLKVHKSDLVSVHY